MNLTQHSKGLHLDLRLDENICNMDERTPVVNLYEYGINISLSKMKFALFYLNENCRDGFDIP